MIPVVLPNLPRVAPGDPVLAEDWNRLTTAIEQLNAELLSNTQQEPQPTFELVDLASDVASRETDKQAHRLWYDAAVPPGQDPWKKLLTGQLQQRVTDVQDCLWLENERHLLYHHAPSGRMIPIPATHIHMAKLKVDLDPFDEASVDVWEVNLDNEVDSNKDIPKVYDWLGLELTADTPVLIFQHLQSRRWYVLHAMGAHVRFGRPSSDFFQGATVTLRPCDADGNLTGGTNVVVYGTFARESFQGVIESTDVCTWIPFTSDQPAGVDGVLVGSRQKVSPSVTTLNWDSTDTSNKTDNWGTGAVGDQVQVRCVTRAVAEDEATFSFTDTPAGDNHDVHYRYLRVFYRDFVIDAHGLVQTISQEDSYRVQQGSDGDMTFLMAEP